MFKKGDKVRIKNYIKPNIPGHIVTSMYKYLGEEAEILHIRYGEEYYLKECSNWFWFENDFEVDIFDKLDDELFKL